MGAISHGGTIMKKLSMLGIVGGAALLAAVPFSLQWSQGNVGPAVPLLTLSHANAQYYGPNRRHVRRVYRRAYRRAHIPTEDILIPLRIPTASDNILVRFTVGITRPAQTIPLLHRSSVPPRGLSSPAGAG